MGLRFFKRIKIAPGLTLNMSKSGPSFSFGPRGLKYTVGPRGTRKTFGVPGTGLYYTTSSGWGKKPGCSSPTPSNVAPPSSLDLGFFRNIATPPAERELVAGLKQYLSGNIDEAFSTFRGNASLVDSVFMLGFLSLGKGLFQEAEAAFVKCRGALGDFGNSIHKYIKGFQLSLQITDYIDSPIEVDRRGLTLAMAEACQKQGKYAEAIQEVTALWGNNPSDAVVCLSLCELVVTSPSASNAELEDIVQMTTPIENDDPIHSNILYLRAAAMYRMQLVDAAIKQLSLLLRKKTDRPDSLLRQIRYLRARLFEQLNQKAKAKKDYEMVYAEDPSFRDVRSRIRLLTP